MGLISSYLTHHFRSSVGHFGVRDAANQPRPCYGPETALVVGPTRADAGERELFDEVGGAALAKRAPA